MPVDEVIEAAEEKGVVLVLVNHNNFRDVADRLAVDLIEDGHECLFLTADRGAQEVREDLGYYDIDPDDFYILDIISEKRGFSGGEDDQVVRINSPTAFNDISIGFTDLYERMEEVERTVIIDSFTAWLLYGGLKEVGNFVKKMSDKAADNGAAMVIAALAAQIDDDVIERFMTFCDEKVDLTDEGRQD